MNDYLKLLITYISTSGKLTKVVLVVEHGMNIGSWKRATKQIDMTYTKELILNSLPLYVKNHVADIVNVESLFSVHTLEYVDEDNQNMSFEEKNDNCKLC